jgi:PiT family inorganic phosphate transporter
MLVIKVKVAAKIHLITFESYIRTGLIIVGAFAAYSLGANNIANVMGVFVPAFNLDDLDLGIITLNSARQLFLLGGMAIAVGIITYSKRVMETVGANIVELNPEAAMVVVLAQSLVLFIFSSSALSSFLAGLGLPRIPLVPVSSSQVIIGCVIGIGLYKGARNINFRLLGEVAIGWIATPLITCILCYLSLFIFKNIFNINVGSKITAVTPESGPISVIAGSETSAIMRYILFGILAGGIILLVFYYLLERKKRLELQKSETKFWKNLK